jgi:tetratricopeptide (TPR) repeat protein
MRRFLHLVAIVSLLLCLAAPAVASPRSIAIARTHAERGYEALSRGHLAVAGSAFAKALAVHPGLPEAHVGLGHVAMKEHRYEDALEAYARAHDAFASLARDLKRMEQENFLERRGDVLALRDMLTQLTSANLKLSDGQRRFKEARINHEIEGALQVSHPGNDNVIETPAPLHFYLGNALFHLDRLPEAVAQWEAAAARDAGFAPVHNNLALAYYRQGRLEQARGSVLRAESLGLVVDPRLKADVGRAAGPFASQQIAAAEPAGAGNAGNTTAAENPLETD